MKSIEGVKEKNSKFVSFSPEESIFIILIFKTLTRTYDLVLELEEMATNCERIDSRESGVDELEIKWETVAYREWRLSFNTLSMPPWPEEKPPAAALEENLKGRRPRTIGNCYGPYSTSWNSPSLLATIQRNGLTMWGSSLNFKTCLTIKMSNWRPII